MADSTKAYLWTAFNVFTPYPLHGNQKTSL
jgi:hypothetical protein